MENFLNEFWADFSKPENMVGHCAYVLLIGSMMMRSMNWLRALAIMAGTISAIFYWTLADYVSFFWESMFTLVNLVQLLILQIENRRGSFTSDEALFVDTCMSDVERAHARKLVKLCARTEVHDSVVLIAEDTCPGHLKFIVEGKARVERKGRLLGEVGPGDFLGEMSYLTGKNATATIITETETRYLAFERKALRAHLEKNPEVRHALEASFNRNLVDKLSKTNQHKLEAVAE